MQETTVLVENAVLLVLTGCAIGAKRSFTLVMFMLCIIISMLVDNILLNALDIYKSNADNTYYYFILSGTHLALFGLMLSRITKMSLVFALCFLIQSLVCFLMTVNGIQLIGVNLPTYDIIYTIHESFNSVVWLIEGIAVWVLATKKHNEK